MSSFVEKGTQSIETGPDLVILLDRTPHAVHHARLSMIRSSQTVGLPHLRSLRVLAASS